MAAPSGGKPDSSKKLKPVKVVVRQTKDWRELPPWHLGFSSEEKVPRRTEAPKESQQRNRRADTENKVVRNKPPEPPEVTERSKECVANTHCARRISGDPHSRSTTTGPIRFAGQPDLNRIAYQPEGKCDTENNPLYATSIRRRRQALGIRDRALIGIVEPAHVCGEREEGSKRWRREKGLWRGEAASSANPLLLNGAASRLAGGLFRASIHRGGCVKTAIPGDSIGFNMPKTMTGVLPAWRLGVNSSAGYDERPMACPPAPQTPFQSQQGPVILKSEITFPESEIRFAKSDLTVPTQ